MKLTDEQRAAAICPESVLLEACPGSGKTRTIIAKLARCVDGVRESARKVACITYTNAAVYEIEHRLRRLGAPDDDDYCEISTIHAFCLNNILQNFHWRIPEYADGFAVLAPDTDRYAEIVAQVCAAHQLHQRAAGEFELLNIEPNGSPILQPHITAAAAQDFWRRLRAEQAIDFPNIVYISYKLLLDAPTLVNALSCRFAWILIDEFQDTSALQVELFSLIAAQRRTQFFVVGDPYQSIYGFAGAKPELMPEFAIRAQCRTDLRLLGNFRSSRIIVNRAELLCPRTPPMEALGDAADFPEEPTHHHGDTAFNVITDQFLPALDGLGIAFGDAAILAPTWFKLLPLGRRLREYGVPVVGPGARPYRRTHLFALLAEQICALIHESNADHIRQTERELFALILATTGSPNYEVYTYRGRRLVYRLLNSGRGLRLIHDSAVDWLMAAAEMFTDILVTEGFLPRSAHQLLTQSAADMCTDMTRNGVDTANLTTDELGIFANPEKSLKLLTMHRAKGREFDAVALVDMHDNRIPHPAGSVDEARRLLYVAITRARHLLFCITDTENWQNSPSRFLAELDL